MPRIKPLSPETVPEVADLLEASKNRMGFLPNSQRGEPAPPRGLPSQNPYNRYNRTPLNHPSGLSIVTGNSPPGSPRLKALQGGFLPLTLDTQPALRRAPS